MRQTLKAAAVAVLLSTAIPAQGQIEIDGYDPYSIPKMFSYTGEPQLVFKESGENGSADIRIYNEKLENIKNLTIAGSKIPKRIVTEERQRIEGQYDEYVEDEYIESGYTLEEATELAERRGATSHTQNGDIHTFQPENKLEVIGAMYEKYVYNESTDELTTYRIQYRYKYGEWKMTDEREEYSYSAYQDFSISNYDDDFSFPKNHPFSQTLFNTDEKYEYILPVYELSSEPDSYIRNFSDEFGVAIKRELYYNAKQTAVNVVSEDGNVLYTFSGSWIGGAVIGGKAYVMIEGSGNTTYYEIDRQTSTVRKVMSENVRIYPRTARRSENITIETGTDIAGQKREVVVTSMDGRVIERCTIPTGVTSTQISTARMTGGVYNFTVYANGEKLENGKIIVR